MFETHLVTRRSNVDYKMFNNFSPHVMKTISGRLHSEPDGMDGISVSLNSDLIGKHQYPESKEFLSGLEKLSKIKAILKHVFILAVSLISTLGFILVLWCMHVFTFVWSGFKHCRHRRDEPNCTAKYGPGAVKEIVLNWDESTETTTSCMACSNIADPTNTNTNLPGKITKVRKTVDLRASKLIGLCQVKIESTEENVN